MYMDAYTRRIKKHDLLSYHNCGLFFKGVIYVEMNGTFSICPSWWTYMISSAKETLVLSCHSLST
eukprot:TRINITY_DN5724_c0_g1_i1.p2 TRINITY_DN5724_c0_g1~~TRINITY_DN5724_c0_g1_i1.p2  ORF type:complete len:65 (+),score=2.63 TRINITY_DN5724_c0_g1_i1:373-567(+)